jgi:hypothetical protein
MGLSKQYAARLGNPESEPAGITHIFHSNCSLLGLGCITVLRHVEVAPYFFKAALRAKAQSTVFARMTHSILEVDIGFFLSFERNVESFHPTLYERIAQ